LALDDRNFRTWNMKKEHEQLRGDFFRQARLFGFSPGSATQPLDHREPSQIQKEHTGKVILN